MFTSAVICKQKRFHENDIVQYFITSKVMALTKAILESPYRVLPRTSGTTTQKNAPLIFTGCSSFN